MNATHPRQDDKLNRAIGVSVALHLLVFVALAVRTVFYPSEPLMLEDSIRVDIVALPDKPSATLPPAPPAAKETKPAPEPAKQVEPEKPQPAPAPPVVDVAKTQPAPKPPPEAPQVNLNKAKREQEAALKRLEALQNLEKMMKSPGQQAAENKAAAANTTGQTVPVKGNVVSNGTSLKGIERLDHQSYLGSIRESVKRHWNLPRWLATANLSARVRIHVDAQGYVIKKELVTPSNNPVFDEKLMAAIDASSPLPAPPGTLTNRVNIDGIELDFSPEK